MIIYIDRNMHFSPKKKIRTHNRTSLGELYVAVHTVHDLKLLRTTEPTYQNQLPGNPRAFTPDGLNNFILMPKMHILLKNYIEKTSNNEKNLQNSFSKHNFLTKKIDNTKFVQCDIISLIMTSNLKQSYRTQSHKLVRIVTWTNAQFNSVKVV